VARKDGQFKPGKSGNPSGRPALPPEVRKSLRLTNEEFVRVASEYMLLTREEINKRVAEPTASVVELLVGNLIDSAITPRTDDYLRALSLLLDRTIGKVKETLEVQTKPIMTIKRQDGTEVVLGSSKDGDDE
jgi:hypothetical protein